MVRDKMEEQEVYNNDDMRWNRLGGCGCGDRNMWDSVLIKIKGWDAHQQIKERSVETEGCVMW